MDWRQRTNRACVKKILFTGVKVRASGTAKQLYNAGLYIFSRKRNDTMFKIGMAGGEEGIIGRLFNYSICYPEEDSMILYYLIMTDKNHAKELETEFLNYDFEKVGTYSKEWRMVAHNGNPRDLLEDCIIETLQRRSDLWRKVVVFWEDSIKVINNDKTLTKSMLHTRPSKSRQTPCKAIEYEEIKETKPRIEYIQPDGKKVFEVEKIVSDKVVRGQRMFLIKWKGYGTGENTYEPLRNLSEKLVRDYDAKKDK